MSAVVALLLALCTVLEMPAAVAARHLTVAQEQVTDPCLLDAPVRLPATGSRDWAARHIPLSQGDGLPSRLKPTGIVRLALPGSVLQFAPSPATPPPRHA